MSILSRSQAFLIANHTLYEEASFQEFEG